MTAPVVSTLEGLLDEEYSAVLSGNFDKLEDILEEKSHRLAALSPKMLPAEALQALQRRIARNQAALSASGAGIRDVLHRLADLRRLESGADFYASNGRRHRISPQNRGTRA